VHAHVWDEMACGRIIEGVGGWKLVLPLSRLNRAMSAILAPVGSRNKFQEVLQTDGSTASVLE
jgi:hypothetical protein